MSGIPGRPVAGFSQFESARGYRSRDESRQKPLRVAMLYPEAQTQPG